MSEPAGLLLQLGSPDPDLLVLIPVMKTAIIGIVTAIVGLPLAVAVAKRIARAGAQPLPAPDVAARLERIEQGIEAIAVEVERISEAQRFATKLAAQRAAPVLGAPGTPPPDR